MMVKIDWTLAKPGDVLLYHGNSALGKMICLFDNSDVNHAGISIYQPHCTSSSNAIQETNSDFVTPGDLFKSKSLIVIMQD